MWKQAKRSGYRRKKSSHGWMLSSKTPADRCGFLFNPEALAEAEEATRWYRENGGQAPSRAFTLELKRVVSLATQNPSIGNPGLLGTSRLYLKRFPIR